MLGCIKPMSSPMMNRMLGFLSWASAGTSGPEHRQADGEACDQSGNYARTIYSIGWTAFGGIDRRCTMCASNTRECSSLGRVIVHSRLVAIK